MSYKTYFYNKSHILQGYINSHISLECANTIKHILHNKTLTTPGFYRLYNSTSNTISYTLYNNLFSQGDISKSHYIKPTEISVDNSFNTCYDLFNTKKQTDKSIEYLNIIRGEASCNILINRDNSNQIRCLCDSSISPVILYTDPLYDINGSNLSYSCSNICKNASNANPKLEINGCKNTILTTDTSLSERCIFSVRNNNYQIKSGYIHAKGIYSGSTSNIIYSLDICNTIYDLSTASQYCINDPSCIGIFTTPLLNPSWVLSYTSTLTKYDDASYITIRNIEHIMSPTIYKSYKYDAGIVFNNAPEMQNLYGTTYYTPTMMDYNIIYNTNINNPYFTQFSKWDHQILINKSNKTHNYLLYFGKDDPGNPDIIRKLNTNYNWTTIIIYSLVYDQWADTKMGWPNSINDELRAYSFSWKVLEWIKRFFTYEYGVPKIDKLLLGGESNGAPFVSRLLEDHARWHYKKGQNAYVSWLRYVDPSNIAALFTAGGSHHCYANPSGALNVNFPDSHFISNDIACGNCLNIATDTSMRNSKYDGQCYNIGTKIPITTIPWTKSCIYCCPRYTQKTYMENSELPYPPILTYQYTNGDCSAGTGDTSSICSGYSDGEIYNNSKYETSSNCNYTKYISTKQLEPSSNCLIDTDADTCATNKLYSVAKTIHKKNFNNKSKSIGLRSYKNLGIYNLVLGWGSHIDYPTIIDNCQNYSIYKWLLDISFIPELSCNVCNISGCAQNKNITILNNRTCISSNSFNYNQCCNGTVVDLCHSLPKTQFSKSSSNYLGYCSGYNKNEYYFCSRLGLHSKVFTNRDVKTIRKLCASSCNLNICLNDDNPNFEDKYKYTCKNWKNTVKDKNIQDGDTSSCSDVPTWSKFNHNGFKPYDIKELAKIMYNCPNACNICPDS